MPDWIDRFNKFLRVRDLFLGFYNNLNDLGVGVSLSELEYYQFLFQSFIWKKSPEGHSYWADVNEEWLESIEEEEGA